LDATYGQIVGIAGEAKMDFMGQKGRVRAHVMMKVAAPARLRFAISADVVGSAGEVASDGDVFEVDDKGNGRYVVGKATPCNVAQVTQVPLPLSELVPMLWGMRPAIAGPVVCDAVQWSNHGYYVVMLRSEGQNLAHELDVAPYIEDADKPFSQQRLRLLSVVGWQGEAGKESLVYRVTMKDFKPVKTAAAKVDPMGIDPVVPPSGPDVTMELPWSIHVEVPSKHSDVIFQYSEIKANPPNESDTFQLHMPDGIPVVTSTCED
jgi:hypothetical protein